MHFLKKTSILKYFDLSIIIPIQEINELWEEAFHSNLKYFNRNGIEVILILAEQKFRYSLLSLIENYPFVNWVVLLPEYSVSQSGIGAWMNCGVQASKNQYVLFIHPCSVFCTDVPYQLRYILEYYPNCFAFDHYKEAPSSRQDLLPDTGKSKVVAGNVMVSRRDFEQVYGFNEDVEDASMALWDFHNRLSMSGIVPMYIPQAITEYITPADHDKCWIKTRMDNFPHTRIAPLISQSLSLPTKEIYHYRGEKLLKHRNLTLEAFETSWVFDNSVFKKEYGVICLIPVRNEANHLPTVLNHLDNYCDGIILLDDGSTDQSYSHAISKKLLLKARKKNKGYFDDLENRNDLLRLGSLFNTEWFFFLDADERFAPNVPPLTEVIKNNPYDVLLFNLVHLWNDDKYYRKDVPHSKDGVMGRYRMFRNKGNMQIISKKEIHFAATPFTKNPDKRRHSLLILHYGLMNQDDRERKYYNYIQQDKNGNKQGHSYDYLIDQTFVLEEVKDIKFGYESSNK